MSTHWYIFGSSKPGEAGGWGVIGIDPLQPDKPPIKAAAHYSSGATANYLEVLAAIAALDLATSADKIISQNKYCVNAINNQAAGIEKKRERAYQRGTPLSKKKVPNLPQIMTAYRLFAAKPGITVEWLSTNSGNKTHERARKIARWARKNKENDVPSKYRDRVEALIREHYTVGVGEQLTLGARSTAPEQSPETLPQKAMKPGNPMKKSPPKFDSSKNKSKRVYKPRTKKKSALPTSDEFLADGGEIKKLPTVGKNLRLLFSNGHFGPKKSQRGAPLRGRPPRPKR